MNQEERRNQVALNRAEILAPVLKFEGDRATHAQKLRQISQQHDVSVRTLRRWLANYRADGFEGLKPAVRDLSAVRVLSDEIVDYAVLLRREVPERSVNDIIRCLELEGRVEPGEVKRSTLQDALSRRGYSASQLAKFRHKGVGAARRFQRTGRNELWQADIKYLLKLPARPGIPSQQVYLSAFIDDATRLPTAVRVYARQDWFSVLDSLYKAIEAYGVPDKIFTDNGKVYQSKELQETCTKLGIELTKARPYSPQAKGKVEAFNRTIDKFVSEERLEHPASVEQVQHDLDCWLEEYYHTNEHSALKGQTPRQAFKTNHRPIRYVSQQELDNAFQWSTTRLVDKVGCISFKGDTWEAGPEYIGLKVWVLYACSAPEELVIEYHHMEPKVIYKQQIGEHTTERRAKAEPLVQAEGSRILEAARNAYSDKTIDSSVEKTVSDSKGKEDVTDDRQGATSFRYL